MHNSSSPCSWCSLEKCNFLWQSISFYDNVKVNCKKNSDHEWPRVTTSDHEWPRSDHGVTTEWPRVTMSEISSKCLITASLKSDFHISSSNYNLLTQTEVIYCVNAQGMICNTFQEKIQSFLLTLKNLRLLFVLPTTAPPPPYPRVSLSLFSRCLKNL